MQFNFPAKSEFNKIVSKEKIYQFVKPSTAIKERFIEQVERIKWQYKLSPETINLPARAYVKEIQIITIKLKTQELHQSVLRTIDKGINFPTIFQLIYKDQIKTGIAYKRPSDSDKQQWVTDNYLESDWQTHNSERQDLPVSLNLESLYEQILRQFIPIESRPDETIKQHIARLNKIHSLESESAKLQSRLNKEKQFNRKVELNAELRTLQAEIEQLN